MVAQAGLFAQCFRSDIKSIFTVFMRVSLIDGQSMAENK